MIERRARALAGILFLATIAWAPLAFSQQHASKAARPSGPVRASGESPVTEGEDHPAAHPPSDAERIARLDRSLEADEKRLHEMKDNLDHPDQDYAEAESEFRELDEQLTEKKKQLEKSAKASGGKDNARLRAEYAALEKKWTLARDRFDLAIEERKATQETTRALEEKIEHDRAALDELRGTEHPSEPGTLPQAGKPVTGTSGGKPSNLPPHKPVPSHAAESEPAKQPKPGEPAEASAVHSVDAGIIPDASDLVDPEELAAATAEAEKTEAEADAAEEEAKSISERIEILQKNIALARQLRDTAQKKVDNADASLKSVSEELFRKMMEKANTDEIKGQVQEATERLSETREESRQAAAQLDELQSTLTSLQAEQLAAAAEAEEKRETANEAAEAVKELNNPFSVHNIMQWLLDHGPKILGILVAVISFLRLSRVLEGRFVKMVASRGRVGNRQERENRAKTLLGIFHNVANIVILGGGAVVILDEVGIPVAPLIGGAAVVGLAVAFGAQSLIKDYFTGFLVLLEQQYLINDVVKINSVTGQVERITLRTTMLRDAEGNVHFIPHGNINMVTNTTHGWSRAVLEVRIAYRENVDRVIEILTELARDLRTSESFGSVILDDPVMLGVDALTDSGVMIKFQIKTRPLHSSPVRRELLRRIKNKFDELDIQTSDAPPIILRTPDKPLTIIPNQAEQREAG